ncbi:MAG TPA: dioxygenase [Caldimonas sp.]
MAQLDAGDITEAVIDRMADCTDERFKTVMTALVRHAHAFLREVQPTEAEWIGAIEFLTAVGKKCDAKRQEFILLSDTLGISMLVVALNQLKAARALTSAGAPLPTEATVQGPFYWEGSPELELGADLGQGMPGEPAYYSGRVTDTRGRPVANCCLDVWSGDGDGVYDMQLGDEAGMRLRARFHTDSEGGYRFWSIRPSFYPVPDDGPVGDMLRRMGRHPNRPGHIHMKVYAPGHQPVTTHLFVADSPYLDSDAVFGVRNSLIVKFEAHPPGTAPDGRTMSVPYHTAHYDFRLVPEALAARA